ncbi:MAG: efflux RND transporter periplasmic adaptor subunit [Prevotella sp.]|jgi:membrane fusion protein (multidrug efflux system)
MNKLNWTIALLSMVFLATGCGKKKQDVENIVKVKTMAAGSMDFTHQQSYPGSIEEMSGTSLSFAAAGTIKSLNISEGQYVKAGQLIGVIDATTTGNALTMAKATTAQARESLNQAEDAYRRMKMLHDNGSLPEIKWVEVKTKVSQARQMLSQAQAAETIARKGLNDTRLLAPFSGYISKKTAETGQNVLPGQPVATLVKIEQVKVKLSVPEDEIADIKIGQELQFTVSSLGDNVFSGKVTEKNIAADAISRAYTVKGVVNNADHKLLPGMVCDVYTSGSTTEGVSLPANIIQIDFDSHPFVWVVQNGTVTKKTVVLGKNVGENVIITKGLEKGAKVIVSGQQKVSSGMKVQE